LSGNWLKRFRGDKPDPLKNPILGKPKTGWIEKFRDDEADPNWLERFPDDAPGREPRTESVPRPAPRPTAKPGPSRNIRLFEWLMYISLLVQVVTTANDFSKLAEVAGGWPVVVLTEVFTLAIFGIFIFVAVYLRKKWALYVIAGLYGFRLLRYIPSFAYIALPLVQFLSAVQFVLQGLALFYAFSGDARAHFAKGKR
jgi:hypothetical protein